MKRPMLLFAAVVLFSLVGYGTSNAYQRHPNYWLHHRNHHPVIEVAQVHAPHSTPWCFDFTANFIQNLFGARRSRPSALGSYCRLV
jgi:hypothetical protein